MKAQPEDSKILEELEELHAEEKEIKRDEKRIVVALFIFSIFIIISIVGVAYLIYQTAIGNNPTTKIINAISSPSSISPTAIPSPSQITPTQTPTPTKKVGNKSIAKDYYINIGSGTNQSFDWTDVSGAVTTANIATYQNIKEVYFEAFINVPTENGKVFVRLFNKTDNYAVWNTELSREGTKDTYKFISSPLIYDKGPKLYQVQMKSQLSVFTNLVSARIRIITE